MRVHRVLDEGETLFNASSLIIHEVISNFGHMQKLESRERKKELEQISSCFGTISNSNGPRSKPIRTKSARTRNPVQS